MSDLVYQNFNNKCQGWVNPSNLFFGPEIISLTGYQSPAGSNTVVSIAGTNFFSYSVIRFGTFTPTVYFINSTLLSFYVPNTLTSGTYPVQVCNGSVCSNIVNYTIDNASGYWLLNPNGNISNTNILSSVVVTSLNRGTPILVDSSIYDINNPYIVQPTDNWIMCDTTVQPVYLSLPNITNFTGREIMIKRFGTPLNAVYNSNVASIRSFDNTNLLDTIMDSSDPIYDWKWVTLVYNGSEWITMQVG